MKAVKWVARLCHGKAAVNKNDGVATISNEWQRRFDKIDLHGYKYSMGVVKDVFWIGLGQ